MSRWIFLRGLTRESRHWGDFPARFRRELADAEITLLDLPGNGEFNDRQSPASVAAMAEACRNELLARGVAPPYQLLAMSLGAMVAVAWADKYPGELRGCVLINTSMRPFNPFWQRLQPRNYPTLLGFLLPGRSARAREEAILRLTSRLAGIDQGVANNATEPTRAQIVEEWTDWHLQRPVSGANALRQLWAASRFRAPEQKPPVPMLVLAGAADQLVDPQCSRQLARHWQTAFAEHPSAGHDLPLDAGAWVSAQVSDWILWARS
ncbi:alpha/beta fold hydrolase [Rhodocyclus tenuis]|uniref:alpha/beta fold hydrolase n=1 Tax=Rhodocyclus tenuis TaxID=1066 RepID=UPI001903274E|nr:alpha/beta hydrolase [Rhodocyclus tenuis]MBK1681600.1 alpha/beta hydrolase [Rhodocyclus tenuis]